MNTVNNALDNRDSGLTNETYQLEVIVLFDCLDKRLEELLTSYKLLLEHTYCVNVCIGEVNIQVIASKDY